ncbi:Ribosomal protein L11 methyltransferase [Candidatus Rubidus massiliensis]|nr:Ribosomal protein L11 methyltransferase [Candidatus Rubidus massiliensis]
MKKITKNFSQFFLSLLFSSIVLSSSLIHAATEKKEKIEVADQLLEKNQSIEEKYTFDFKGLTFVGYPNVYSPVIFPGASKQGKIPLRKGDSFLEMGCGTGIFSILAALEGADRVVAIDVNPDAVANTKENVRLHNLEKTITVLEGDMFSPLNEKDKFDVIFFNIPFCHKNCNVEDLSMLGRSLYDPEHDILYRFLKEGKNHLAPKGVMILGYSTTHGDVPLMMEWAEKFHWDVQLIHKIGDETKDFVTVEMYKFSPK